jgi:ankyrin repeat protein
MVRGKEGNTILHLLAANGKADLISPLLSKDSINSDLSDQSGQTPLLYAAKNGHKEIVEMLLARDHIDLNFADHR